jgi:hypothetical protein
MKEKLIDFETAKLAKEKGFLDKNIYSEVRISQDNIYFEDGTLGTLKSVLNTDITFVELFNAPTQALLQKWLRDIHGIHISIDLIDDSKNYGYDFDLILSNKRNYMDDECMDAAKRIWYSAHYNTYEIALEKALQEALKLI